MHVYEDDSWAQNYGPNEVVISDTSNRNKIEELEAQLAKLSRDHAHHSTKLKEVLAEELLMEFLFEFLFNGIDARKLIVIFVAFFLLIRLVFMVDVNLVLAFLNLISLIILIVGYKREEHLFFWPSFLSCIFECDLAFIQMVLICWLIYDPSKPKSLVEDMNVFFSPVLIDQMTDTFGLLKIFFYVACKLIVFAALGIGLAIIGIDLFMRKFNVAKERKHLAKIDGQKMAIKRQLKLLRPQKSSCPVDP
ncbi:hypothetical protein M3Y96_00920400 [Aphelenchoides besseyi]|nr:hypothetical protein M3Y96_00920400 [Aphelenchoides besseyi]